MKFNLRFLSIIAIVLTAPLLFTGCHPAPIDGPGTTAPEPAGTNATVTPAAPKVPTAAQVEQVLNTGANLLETINTGLLAAAPTVADFLTLFHNSGDAALVTQYAADDSVGNAALKTMLSNVQTAIAANTAVGGTPAMQQAAVAAAIAPPAVASIVAPIATVSQ